MKTFFTLFINKTYKKSPEGLILQMKDVFDFQRQSFDLFQ